MRLLFGLFRYKSIITVVNKCVSDSAKTSLRSAIQCCYDVKFRSFGNLLTYTLS